MSRRNRSALAAAAVAVAVLWTTVVPSAAPSNAQESYQRISGEGSSWAANAIDAMRVNVKQFGITVDYNPSGSSAGRKNWLNGTVDFAASDIPFQFQPEDGSAPERPEAGSYAYIPVTAGGTSFMYNLKIGGQRVTNLRLSGENVAKIFTGAITQWNDPALAADNPGLDLPARKIVPVVRSDGSGSTAQFTGWLIDRHPAIWNAYCTKSGRAPACGQTSFYPTISGMIAQAGDLGVAGYVAQSFAEGAIGYANYSYALNAGFPVVKVLNAAGYYTEPSPENVAVALLQARINTNKSDPSTYLTQDLRAVYSDADPRNYQLSSYSYFILPTKVRGQFNEAKGRTLGAFAYYAMCQAQQQSASLGYSPIPINLVTAAFDQIRLVPGAEVQNINIQQCKNPTFSSDGTNTLAKNAPMPYNCDAKGALQCPFGTAGATGATAVKASASGGQTRLGEAGGGGGAGGGAGGSGVGGATGGGTAGGGSATGGGTGSGGSTSSTGDAVGGTTECDPETGICASVDGAGGDAAGIGLVAATPTVLANAAGWGSTQTLMVIVAALTLGLVLAPALLWRRLSRLEVTR
ncbi:MAG: phosphate ABC transporter substrate-binding protein PstS [Actinomycetota bacterium]